MVALKREAQLANGKCGLQTTIYTNYKIVNTYEVNEKMTEDAHDRPDVERFITSHSTEEDVLCT